MTSSNMIAEEYTSSLSDLTVNSKPLINMLTMLAEENREHAPAIVQAVEKHLQKVPSDIKLPVLYLIDSIVKNVGHAYIDLFTQNIVSTFCGCFEKVDERTRAQMFKLRQTWNEVFPAKKLYAVDLRVHSIDPAWPITAAPPTSIHVNPKFFAKQPTQTPQPAPAVVTPATQMAMPPVASLSLEIPESRFVGEIQMRDQLLRKQKELIELQQQKLTLESMQLKAQYEEQQRKLQQQFFQNRPALLAPSSGAVVVQLDAPLQKAKPTPTSVKMASVTKLQSQQLPSRGEISGTSAKNVATSPQQNNARTVPAPTSPVKQVSRVRDPRLAARVLSATVAQDKSQFDRLIEGIQSVEPAKPKLHITNNLGCDNKNNVPNKERRGITKPIMSTKARNTSKLSPTNVDAFKGQESSKSNVLQPSSSLSPSTKKFARLKESPKLKFIDQLPPIPKIDENRKDQDVSTKKSSPSKTLSPRKKAQLEKDKSPKSKNNDKESTLISKSDSPRRKAVDKKTSDNLSFARATGNVRDRSKEHSKFDVDLDGSPSPPPPPTISESKIQDGGKLRIKPSLKGRNYIRRNRGSESRSRSPIKSDVDLRLSGPPEKMQKLTLPEDTAKKPLVDATINVDATKDVDLRQLPGKRASSERETGDQPPVKKSRAELIDVLFGNEDVDLRTLGTSALPQQPSPPPPPIISQLSPSSSNSDSCTSKSDTRKVHLKAISADEHLSGNGDVHPRDWSKFKGPKSPISASPYRTRRGMNKPSPGELDRLGRPFLFQRSSDTHKESRRTMVTSEDTDMRRRSKESYNAGDSNMQVMLAQAQEQNRNGTLTSKDYHKLLSSMIRMNESKKLQEAKWRDENWKPRRQRQDLSPVSDDGSLAEPAAEFSPCSDTSEGNHRSPPPTKSVDLDERFARAPHHMQHKPRAPRYNNWAWGHKPQPWMPRPMRPMQQPPPFIRHPGNEGAFGWRPPHQPFMPQMQGPPAFPAEHPRFFGPRPEHFDSRPRPVDDQFVPHGSDYDSHAEHHLHPELPLADTMVLEHIANDSMRTINIDGQPREIRYYGETALTMLDWDDPREVVFQRGTRRVLIDDRDSFVCAFNDTYRDCIIDGNPHKIRFGAPTRELYIDGKWYECYFGGPPITIEIDGKMRTVKLEGPPPQVKLGYTKRLDLCAAKITVIVNAIHMVPIYLDAKPQRFDIENKPHILRFVNALTTVLINGQPFDVEFGGLPKPIIVRNKKHFIRFGALPPGIKPGFISIRNMEGGRLPSPTQDEQEDEEAVKDNSLEQALHQGHSAEYPAFTSGQQARQTQNASSDANSPQDHDLNCEQDDEPVNAVTGVYVNNKRTGGSVSVPLDILTSLLPTTLAPSSGFGYQVEPESASQDGSGFSKSQESSASVATDPTTANSSFNQFAPATVEAPLTVAELFQKLVATGMVPLEKPNEVGAPVESKKEEEISILKHVDFKSMDTLRARQPGMVAILYSGIQCSSCGVRFPPEETLKYSQHLDWHFRQNRRDRDNVRKAQSRKWYYEVSDWLLYEEIEDLEHRTPSLFEPMPEASIGEDNEPIIIPSVPVGENSENPFCEMCHDKFEQFYNEESEEWHLKLAIRVDGKIYHPLCYDDFRASTLLENSTELKEEIKEEEPSATKEEHILTTEASVKEEEMEVEEIIFVPMEIKKESSSDSEDIIETGRVDASVPQGPTEDLTKQEDIEEENLSEGEIIVAAILDDVLESAELQLFGPRPVKLEPVDDVSIDVDAQQVKLPEESAPLADTTHAAVVSSIDGNVQFEEKLQTSAAGSKIKINITKPIPVREAHPEMDPETSSVDNDTEHRLSPLMRTASDEDSEPPPPGVETLPEPAKLKPKLVGRQFTILPPVNKGSDLSGLCSIM